MNETKANKRQNEALLLRLTGLAALVLVAVRLIGSGADVVAEAEQRWQDSAVSDYRIQVRELQGTWCYYDVNTEVRGGQVVTSTITAHYGPARGCWNYTGGVVEEPVGLSPETAARWTVPGLFDIARQWEDLGGDKDLEIALEFDPKLGYPVRLFRDNTVAIDDQEGLSVVDFQVPER